MATNVEKKLIHTLARTLGFEREVYEDILFTRFQKKSSTDLTSQEAAALIQEWLTKAEKAGSWKKVEKKTKSLKFEELGERSGFATPKQLRMLEVLWMTHSREKTEQALCHFLERIVKVSHLRFLKKKDVQKIKIAIENMR